MRVVEYIKSLLPLSLGVKLFLSSLFGLLVGNKGFLFIIYAAIYIYCVNSGVRVAAEELDILNPTIQIVSFSFTLISGLILLLTIALAIWVRKQKFLGTLFIEGGAFRKWISKTLFFKLFVIFAAIFSICLFLFVVIGDVEGSQKEKIAMFIAFIGMALAYLLLLGILARENNTLLSWFGIFLGFTLLINATLFVINNKNVKSFLHNTKYGGNYLVEIERDCHNHSECNPTLTGPLFLRTKNFIILYQTMNSEVYEIPNKDIITIKYKTK